METFSEIFAALIQDHGKRPRHFRPSIGAHFQAKGINPTTGDRFEVFFVLDPQSDAQVMEVTFTGHGSSLALASASIMTSVLCHLSPQQALTLARQTLHWLTGEASVPSDLPESEHSHLLEVRHFPHRVPCASLPWKTAVCALEKGLP